MNVAWSYAVSVEDVVGDDIDLYWEASDWETGGLRSICSSKVNAGNHFGTSGLKLKACNTTHLPHLLSNSHFPNPLIHTHIAQNRT